MMTDLSTAQYVDGTNSVIINGKREDILLDALMIAESDSEELVEWLLEDHRHIHGASALKHTLEVIVKQDKNKKTAGILLSMVTRVTISLIIAMMNPAFIERREEVSNIVMCWTTPMSGAGGVLN